MTDSAGAVSPTSTSANGAVVAFGSPAHVRRAYRATIAVLWLVLGLVVLLNKQGAFTPDIKPEIYLAPARTAANLATSWVDTQQLGFPNFNVGLAPVAAFVALLRTLGFGPALTVRLIHLGLLVLAATGATRLYAELAGRHAARTGRLLAGLLYVANPYTIVAGDTLAIMLPYAVLPWQVTFFVRALERPRSWRWPAAFALTFVAMSGMNAGVVPALQLVYVPAVVAYVVATRSVTRAGLVGSLARCGVLTLAVSLYWLVPAFTARGLGAGVVNNSETLTGIAATSSISETLRGLGLWVMYGRGPDGPWQPGFVSYLTNPFVIVFSFALPVLVASAVLLAHGAFRRLALAMVVLATLVMVGIFPPDNPSPVGRALRYLFTHVPAFGAFRTTNKAGAVLMLGAALLVAAGGATLVRRLSGTALAFACAGLAVLLLGATWPAWSGGLFSDRLDVPEYWREAAAAADQGSPTQRVWLVPGQVRSHYRWSQERVDDIDKSLLSRPSFVWTTIPNPSPVASNLLTAVDTQLQEGALPPGALSTAARYLGVSDILVRNDVVWELTGGARPSVVQDQVARDAGLARVAAFGAPGENTRSPTEAPVSVQEAALPPVERYLVAGSRPMARVEAMRGSVLVDGDGWAVAPLVAAGLLPTGPAFRYVGDMSVGALDQALRTGTRLVITDTNRRRRATISQLADSQGPLLTAREDPGPSRALFGPDAQTVLQVTGGSVSATSSGGVFVAQPNAAPENAFDGDPRTAWIFGDFGRADGQSIVLRAATARDVSEVAVLARPRGPVTISQVRIQVGSLARTLRVPRSGVAHLRIPTTTTDRVQLTVTRTRGVGINPVAIDEVTVPGVRVRRVARLPEVLDELVRRLPAAGRQALGLTPVDVVFSRALGTRPPEDDEETGLDRDFTLPVDRTFRLYGVVRPDSAASDDTIDRLLGVTGDVVATSSSRAFQNPDVRASSAVDGNPLTAWSPATSKGSWLELTGRPRRVNHIDVRLPSAVVSHVRLVLDGRVAAEVPVHQGLNRIQVGPHTVRRLRLVVTGVTGSGLAQVSEIGFGGARMRQEPGRALHSCVTVGSLDGRAVDMRPVQPLKNLEPTVFRGCHGPLRLSAGLHKLRAVNSWMPDELVLRDSLGEAMFPVQQPSTRAVARQSASHWRVTATLPPGPQLLVLGQNYDPRWTASIDGRRLGQPIAADGYSAAWVVNAPGSHVFDIRFAPQRYATAAWVVSSLSLLLSLGLVLRRERRVPRTALRSTEVRGWRKPPNDLLGWSVVVTLASLCGGVVVGSVALALALWHVWRPPPARQLLTGAVALLVLTPAAFIVGNSSRWGSTSATLVWHNQWPHWLAGCAVLLLCVGVWREDRHEDRRRQGGS